MDLHDYSFVFCFCKDTTILIINTLNHEKNIYPTF